MSSQGTFEDRIGKYKAGDVLIQSYVDYVPPAGIITKVNNTAFIASVDAANILVVNKKQIIDDKKAARLPLCFTQYSPNAEIGILNPDCAQERIVRVHSYLAILLGAKAKTVNTLADIIKTIRPFSRGATSTKSFTVEAAETIAVSNVVNGSAAINTGKTILEWQEVGSATPFAPIAVGATVTISAASGKVLINNTSNEKGGKIKLLLKSGKDVSQSSAEKTFASIAGYLVEVITLIQGIAPAFPYSPPDIKLTLAELNNLKNAILTANNEVTSAMNVYGESNRLRKDLYESETGMTKRIAMIKRYLGSFPNGKKSNHYIEFSQAIKGT